MEEKKKSAPEAERPVADKTQKTTGRKHAGRKRARRRKKRALRMFLAVLITIASVIFLSVFFSEIIMRVEMPSDARMTLYYEEDGSLRLTWPEVNRTSLYLAEIFAGEVSEKTQAVPLYSALCAQPECTLPESILQEEALTIRLNTHREIRLFGRELNWKGRRPLTASCRLKEPPVALLQTSFDDASKTMQISWEGAAGDGFALFRLLAEDTWEVVQQVESAPDAITQVTFGEGGSFAIPERGMSVLFKIRGLHREGNLIICGKPQEVAEVVRDDLMPKEVLVESVSAGENRFTLTWNDTAGDGYEVQRYDKRKQEWLTLRSFTPEEERTYDTGYLSPGSAIEMRVVTQGGKLMEDTGYAAAPGLITLDTEVNPLYATIWPMKELQVYSDPGKRNAIGSVPAGGALCVLEDAGSTFLIRTNEGRDGYIDNTACMINLVEYVGERCQYDITNSYACIYRVQGYAMPGLTGTAIPGDEHEVLADGTFVVPLLYPLAKDFVKIIEEARADGYQFKIYSAFRPLVATNYLYNTTAGFLKKTLPENTWERISVDEYVRNGPKPPTEEELPPEEEEPEEEAEAGQEETEEAKEGADADAEASDAPEEEARDTYEHAMTNGVYSLNWFFASGANSHNFGTAIDLTIASLETGEEMEMQSPIHELSWLSTLDRNNEHSDRLQQYMKNGGYATLFSEWWHFQVNEAHGKYGIGALQNGISIEGWKKDDTGWRYRLTDGTYHASTTVEIGGKAYTFDENGYTTDF